MKYLPPTETPVKSGHQNDFNFIKSQKVEKPVKDLFITTVPDKKF